MKRSTSNLIISILATMFASLFPLFSAINPNFATWLYDNITMYISRALSIKTSMFNFSLIEYFISSALAFSCLMLIAMLIKCWVKRSILPLIRLLAVTLSFVLVLYSLVAVLWLPNYQKPQLDEQFNLTVKLRPTIELVQLSSELARAANEIRAEVTEDFGGIFVLPNGREAALAGIAQEMHRDDIALLLGGTVDVIPKQMAFPAFMGALGIAGIYSPWTGEALVNLLDMDMQIPFTIAHELAHSMGIAHEDDANYIAWRVLKGSSDINFKYSGYITALKLTMRELYKRDNMSWQMVWQSLSSGVERDLRAQNELSTQPRSMLRSLNYAVNDAFLKVNGVNDGVNSYGRLIDYLLAERE